jgi:hypothetical protein
MRYRVRANLNSLVQERAKIRGSQNRFSILAEEGDVERCWESTLSERLGKSKIAGMSIIPTGGYDRDLRHFSFDNP